MKNYAKSGTRKGKTAFRTPSTFKQRQRSKVNKSKTTRPIKK